MTQNKCQLVRFSVGMYGREKSDKEFVLWLVFARV